jgi:hypothetical protein
MIGSYCGIPSFSSMGSMEQNFSQMLSVAEALDMKRIGSA